MNKVLVVGAGGVAAVSVVKMAMHPEIFGEITLASRTLSKCGSISIKVHGVPQDWVCL
jgi:saccharopine dehydrogenase (NAD+, L-lysine-forming)